MPRHYAPISLTELQKKVFATLGAQNGNEYYLDHTLIRDKLGKDIKVEFSFENFATSPNDFGPKSLMGLRSLSEGGPAFWGLCAGGDWEHPVFFILYWDGKRVRGYVPTDGNPWNTDTRTAYGNDDEADLRNARKRYPDASFESVEEFDAHDFDFDVQLIEQDIRQRLTLATEKPVFKDAQTLLQERDEALHQVSRLRAQIADLIADDPRRLRLDYTNHKGERAWRNVIAFRFFRGTSEWHSEVQELLEAYDIDRKERRTFAVKNIHNIHAVERKAVYLFSDIVARLYASGVNILCKETLDE